MARQCTTALPPSAEPGSARFRIRDPEGRLLREGPFPDGAAVSSSALVLTVGRSLPSGTYAFSYSYLELPSRAERTETIAFVVGSAP